MSTDLISINPNLSPLKKQADEVKEAIEEYRKAYRHEPCYLHIPPSDWRAGIQSGYCGLVVLTDLGNDGPKFRVSA